MDVQQSTANVPRIARSFSEVLSPVGSPLVKCRETFSILPLSAFFVRLQSPKAPEHSEAPVPAFVSVS